MDIYTSVSQIERLLHVPGSLVDEALKVESFYPFRCTSHYLNLVEYPSYRDPIFAQFFPSVKELEGRGFEDPFGEENTTPHPHLIRRYGNRLLVLSTNVCFVHCRFCTRKRLWRESPFVFEDTDFLRSYLDSHPEIEDVLISGGDPLTLPTDIIERILITVRSLPTVRVVRIGTRAPVVAPDTVYDKLRVLERFAPLWINTHFNHPKEMTEESKRAVMALIKAGCSVNNQTVLLRGVNDSYETLRELFVGLLSMGVRPYYLFVCDPVVGASHFSVPVRRALQLVMRLRREASGMAVPHLAVDGPYGKEIIP